MILVGGFLGAGKTTLLLAAARHLRGQGGRVGVILNDQGADLVDTRLAESAGFPAEEIAGGCFCCRFSQFMAAVERLAEREAPEFILAEPVGSCTDLSATILQPIKRYHSGRFRLAPLTVLVDPARAEELLRPDGDPLAAYLFQKQIAEADVVCFSKADRYERFPTLDGIEARKLSALTGFGIPEWLNALLAAGASTGSRLLEIDYQLYAEAEAALGWLNWRANLHLARALTPAALAGPLIAHLDKLLTESGIAIAHLKVFAQSANGYLKASVCRNGEKPSVEGQLDAPPARRYALTLNLRALGAPEKLSAAVEHAIHQMPGTVRVTRQQSFRPSPPMPEHRFKEVV